MRLLITLLFLGLLANTATAQHGSRGGSGGTGFRGQNTSRVARTNNNATNSGATIVGRQKPAVARTATAATSNAVVAPRTTATATTSRVTTTNVTTTHVLVVNSGGCCRFWWPGGLYFGGSWYGPGWYYGPAYYPGYWYGYGAFGYNFEYAPYATISGVKFKLDDVAKADRKAVEAAAVYMNGDYYGYVGEFSGALKRAWPLSAGEHDITVVLHDGRHLI